MENKSLKKGIDSLPFPQYFNSQIDNYETVQGKDGATFTDIKNSIVLPVRLEETGIYLPIDIRGIEKSPLYIYNSINEPEQKVIATPAFDFIGQSSLSGIISTNKPLDVYIQESHNQSEWFTINKISVVASTTETIGLLPYFTAVPVRHVPSVRYVRLIFKFGGVATTKFSAQLFSSSL